eukprot:UN27488
MRTIKNMPNAEGFIDRLSGQLSNGYGKRKCSNLQVKIIREEDLSHVEVDFFLKTNFFLSSLRN